MKAERTRIITGHLSRVSSARKRGDATEQTLAVTGKTIRLIQEIDKAILKWSVT